MSIQVYKLKEVISQVNSHKIVLPNFQREFTYSNGKQKELILSLFCGIPIGTVLTLHGPGTSFQHREIGRKSSVSSSVQTGDRIFLLDGQQRITTCWNALTDVYAGLNQNDKDALLSEQHPYLHSRWFIRFRLDEQFSDDIWGFKTLNGGGDLQLDLLPDELSPFIVIEKEITSSRFNWEGGLEFPNINSSSSDCERLYDKYLRSKWSLPIHLISNPALLNDAVARIASARVVELLTKFTAWKVSSSFSFDSLDDEDKKTISEVLGVHSKQDFDSMDQTRIHTLLMARQSGWMNRITSFCQKVLDADVGVVQLGNEALSKGHVIFDVINRAGIKLTAFDLFCATKPGLDVRSQVNEMVPDFVGMKDKNTGLVSDKFTNQLLNLLRIVHAHRRGEFKNTVLKEDKIFSLSSQELKKFLADVIKALTDAYQVVNERCGVPSIEKMPYELRILPLAFAIYLKVSGHNHSRSIYLYWLTLFSGRYRESQNARCVNDLEAVREVWQGKNWDSVYDVDGTYWSSILDVKGYNNCASLIPGSGEYESRSSVRDGLLQWVLSKNPTDFPPNTKNKITSKSKKLEIHHILPIGSHSKLEESTKELRKDKKCYLNSPLNLCYISSDSNRAIGSMSYQQYSDSFTKEIRMDHCLPFNPRGVYNETWSREWLNRRFDVLQTNIKETLQVLNKSI